MIKTIPIIQAALLALVLSVFIPVSVSAYQVGDQFEPPAVDVPFAGMTVKLKTEFDYDQGGETGSQLLKVTAEVYLGKSDGIHPEAGMLIDFELLPPIFEGSEPGWWLPIPAGAFVEENGTYKMSGTPKELGIQLLVVEDGVVVADLTDSIEYIKATLLQAGIENPTFIIKLMATGYFEGTVPDWFLPLGAAAAVQIFFPDANGLTDGGGATNMGQKVKYGGGISH